MKERIAVFLDTKKNSGGAYEELLYMVEKIDKINKNELDIVIISTSKEVSQVFKKKNFESRCKTGKKKTKSKKYKFYMKNLIGTLNLDAKLEKRKLNLGRNKTLFIFNS